MVNILCLIPSLPQDLNPACPEAISHQTVQISKTVMLLGKLNGGTLSSRVSYTLNKALENVDLTGYDYILRVDGDTILEPTWLETALKSGSDLYGGWGFAMLIRVKPFLRLMGGRFNVESDDSYLIHKFGVEGCKVRMTEDLLLRTRSHKHAKNDKMFCGTIYYKLGYEPFHVSAFLITNLLWGSFADYNFRDMWYLWMGYMVSVLKRESKFDFAHKVWHYQIRRLLGGRKSTITTITR